MYKIIIQDRSIHEGSTRTLPVAYTATFKQYGITDFILDPILEYMNTIFFICNPFYMYTSILNYIFINIFNTTRVRLSRSIHYRKVSRYLIGLYSIFWCLLQILFKKCAISDGRSIPVGTRQAYGRKHYFNYKCPGSLYESKWLVKIIIELCQKYKHKIDWKTRKKKYGMDIKSMGN